VLEVESPVSVVWPELTKTATMPSPVPLQKHSLCGCTVDIYDPSNFRRRRTYRFTARCLVFCAFLYRLDCYHAVVKSANILTSFMDVNHCYAVAKPRVRHADKSVDK